MIAALRAWLRELLAALRSPGDRFPVGDMRDLMVDVLGLIGAGTLVMVVVGVAAVPTPTAAGMVVAVLFGLAPLGLRWLVQRGAGAVTVPLPCRRCCWARRCCPSPGSSPSAACRRCRARCCCCR